MQPTGSCWALGFLFILILAISTNTTATSLPTLSDHYDESIIINEGTVLVNHHSGTDKRETSTLPGKQLSTYDDASLRKRSSQPEQAITSKDVTYNHWYTLPPSTSIASILLNAYTRMFSTAIHNLTSHITYLPLPLTLGALRGTLSSNTTFPIANETIEEIAAYLSLRLRGGLLFLGQVTFWSAAFTTQYVITMGMARAAWGAVARGDRGPLANIVQLDGRDDGGGGLKTIG